MRRLLALCISLSLILGGALTVAAEPAQPAAASTQGPGQQAAEGPLAPEVYKNIQVLTDVPADQIEVTMQYVAAATGLECGNCHVRDEATGAWAYDSDDIRTKQTARRMMRLVYGINAGDYGVRAQCATCHAGHERPPGLPLASMATPEEIAAMMARQAEPGAAQGARGGAPGGGPQRGGRGGRGTPPPAPADVVGKYVAAIGGDAALTGLQSLAMTGTVTDRFNRSMPFTIEEKAPGRFRETMGADGATTVRGFDGTTGWMENDGMVTDLTGFALQQAARIAGPPADATIADRAESMRAGRPSRLDDRPVNMLLDPSTPGISERLYFDAESGLLLRRTISTGTVLGNLVEQIDYDDYRAVGDLMLPHTITHTTWNAVDTFRVSDIQVNAPLADSVFSAPRH